MADSPLRWNYYNVVIPFLRSSKTALDMETGGGEAFSKFAPFPETTYATEAYPPNFEIARERLTPLGVKVIWVEENKQAPFNDHLPFADNYFDLVLNRHAAYFPKELHRILKPGGHFITQQVGNLSLINLRELIFGQKCDLNGWNLNSAVEELKRDGFEIIEKDEEIGFSRIYDIGAVIFYVKAIVWTFPDFSLDKYQPGIDRIAERIREQGYYDFLQHRFIIIARKP
jgi:SAM-dependent methyltransferase